MRTWHKKAARGFAQAGLVLLLVSGLCGAPSARAATLDPAALPKIEAATFEVVQAKPASDPLTYEKPLPLDLLPYQERTDKYHSIGTAFAIGHGRYVTAGHVLLAGLDSLWGPPALRDSKGNVYAIDKIEKFALRKDFVVFTLATQPASDAALAIDAKPALNTAVYAVGNALGTGVVIRDGLYTSDTPEEQDGAWKWMRFSAAASPGNSGGPLLDQSGKVIGVVLMKSANENLNYALPITEVLQATDDKAVMDSRMVYQLDIFNTLQNGSLKDEFALPMRLADFYRNLQTRFDATSETQLKALLAKESADLFPNGQDSASLLYEQTQVNSTPRLIVRGSDGKWIRAGYQSRNFALEDNGYVDIALTGRNMLVHISRPDDMAGAKFYGDAKLRMDLLARTGMFQRAVAGEKTKITSLGEPTSETVHVDRWQRSWKVDAWPLPYANALVVAYSLPVPDGSAMLIRIVPAANEHDTKLDLDALTDFIDVSFIGNLAQWKEFLGQASSLPAAFHNIHIDFDYGHRFSYASQRVAYSLTSDVQKITPRSELWLGFRVVLEGDKPVWDATVMDLWEDEGSNKNNVDVQRFVEPPPGIDGAMSDKWPKLAGRQYPYNGVARYEDSLMKIDVVAAQAGATSPKVLYTAFYGIEGNQPQAFMKSRLGLLTKDLRVTEH
ncbi:trypsin-like peptidase domain-containing protein [Rhodanobacter sp. Si-c]|uniref:Trypsin-like peptidase domain-containing protein n=1 Tax=Rhodanobacter lycopersici TaxID=3162487 RepID=A0ABV3QCY0_9GAMM